MPRNAPRRPDHGSPAADEGSEGDEGVDLDADRRDETGPSRGEMVGLALQIDAMIARSDELGLDLVAYLLDVARAELGERLGERLGARRAARRRPDMPSHGTDEDA